MWIAVPRDIVMADFINAFKGDLDDFLDIERL